ncbi:MAG: 4-hydroxythreonine-4-phosphate dehydrogenase PdxA [Pirellulaceae bacterium]|nr:4-hydroxythreonine-4-phosphate dehydrogenase PdxA [Pirellulaceae bacterium]
MSKKRPADRLPRIAITVGDAAGVGPELALQCAGLDEIRRRCVPLVFGPQAVVAAIAERLGVPCPKTIPLESVSERTESALVDVGNLARQDVRPGHVDKATGQASFDAVDFAITAALRHDIDAIVTGPIHKHAWNAAGIEFPGHTELLADRTGTTDFCMMLTSETISCVLATIHIPLADVSSTLSTQLILRAIRLGGAALSRRLGRPARITVCGLNPHAGENGLFSHGEETNLIVPAIEQARQSGLQVTGPLPPDTAFTPAIRQRTDVYVCMYHDQGLIPLKALSFDDAVNVTLGLPIVRTSVDHGTALDLAWQGKANHQSMLAAITMAVDLC